MNKDANNKGTVMSAIQMEIESAMAKEISGYFEWDGLESPVKLLFDLFTEMSNKVDESQSKVIYDYAWESLRLIKTLTTLHELNEQRNAAIGK